MVQRVAKCVVGRAPRCDALPNVASASVDAATEAAREDGRVGARKRRDALDVKVERVLWLWLWRKYRRVHRNCPGEDFFAVALELENLRVGHETYLSLEGWVLKQLDILYSRKRVLSMCNYFLRVRLTVARGARRVRPRADLAGASVSSFFASASVIDFGSVSLGILAFFLPSVM